MSYHIIIGLNYIMLLIETEARNGVGITNFKLLSHMWLVNYLATISNLKHKCTCGMIHFLTQQRFIDNTQDWSLRLFN